MTAATDQLSPPDDANVTRWSFGAAHLAKSLVWSTVDLLLAYFLIAILKMPSDVVTRLLFMLLIAGALFDVAVGVGLTWLQAGPATTLAVHMVGAVATSGALFAQFGLPDGHAPMVLAAGLCFRLAYALYDVPQSALTTLLPRDADDARAYVRLRTTLSAVARLGVTAANLGLAQLPATVFRAGGAALLTAFAAAMVLTAGVLSWIARPGAITRPERPRLPWLQIPDGLWRLLLAFLISTTLWSTLSRLLIFSPATTLAPHLGPWLLVSFSVGSVVGPALAQKSEDLMGSRKAIVAMAALAVLAGNLFILRPASQAPGLSIVEALIYGVGLGGAGAFLWQTASTVALAHRRSTGEHADGLVFGAVIFTIHVSIALGALVLGWLIEDFVHGGGHGLAALAVLTSLAGAAVALLLLTDSRLGRARA